MHALNTGVSATDLSIYYPHTGVVHSATVPAEPEQAWQLAAQLVPLTKGDHVVHPDAVHSRQLRGQLTQAVSLLYVPAIDNIK